MKKDGRSNRALSKEENLIQIVSEPYNKMYGGKNRRFVVGLCKCGKKVEMIYSPISNDYPKSCGCRRLVFKDRFKAKKMRSSYKSMINRCYDKNNHNYKYYGGKGVTVCERWLNGFEYFYEDMSETWFKGGQIDRYPNNKGNYEPLNCRWATAQDQQRNKPNCLKIEDVKYIRASNLKQTVLAEMFGVRANTISRIKNNKRWQISQ